MTSPIGSGAGIRAAIALTFWHRYTRTAVTYSTDTTYGPAPVEGTPATDQRCRYATVARVQIVNGSPVQIIESTLDVPHDDPIKVGDLVSAVNGSDGRVLLAGPVAVDRITEMADAGPTLMRTVVLRGGDIQ